MAGAEAEKDVQKDNSCCKLHTGLRAEMNTVRTNQHDRDATVERIWTAIERKMSVKMMISISSAIIIVLGIIVGTMWSGQRDMLLILNRNQCDISSQLTDLKIDVEVIKHTLKDRDDES